MVRKATNTENSAFPLKNSIFSIQNEADFERISMEVFRYQAEANETFSSFLRHLNCNPERVSSTNSIPFLPISFFKSHRIVSSKVSIEKVFRSSGTMGNRSSHYITDLDMYDQSLLKGFRLFYGDPSQYIFLALLPTYLENPESSLVYMVDQLMDASGHDLSGYYRDDYPALKKALVQAKLTGRRIFLWGVTYALLDFGKLNGISLRENDILMETGGMKGMRKEVIREELHETLRKQYGVKHVHSEYGMSEMLSQAYLKDNTLFECPPWLKIKVRDVYDPFRILEDGSNGAINVIDLANVNSCSFIATDDLGRTSGRSFEVLGRIDYSDLRGCNLL